jgi:Delta7-sterol 5-desaturase
MLIMWLYTHGKTRIEADGSSLGLLYNVVSFAFLVVFNDAWFFVIHRTLHTPWLYKHIHSHHHKSIDVTPYSSYAFHPAEGLLMSAWIVPYLMFVPTALPVTRFLRLCRSDRKPIVQATPTLTATAPDHSIGPEGL